MYTRTYPFECIWVNFGKDLNEENEIRIPGSHFNVIIVSVLFAVKLYGGLGATFSIMISVSAVMVAASLVAVHW